jgi:hypothetical protein
VSGRKEFHVHSFCEGVQRLEVTLRVTLTVPGVDLEVWTHAMETPKDEGEALFFQKG